MSDCKFCPDVFPSAGIANRHMEWEHPEEYAADREAAEKAAAEKNVVVEEDERFTKDGFLKATGRRKSAPSLYPQFPSEAQPLPPWEREAFDADS